MADQSIQAQRRRRDNLRPLDLLLLLAGAVLAVLLLVQVAHDVVWVIWFPYEGAGWAEGHFLHNAVQLSRGENIYVDPAEHPVTTLPYGFFYPLVIAPLVRVFGPELWIGRLISAAATGTSLIWVFITATRRAGSAIAGLFGVVFALTTFYLAGCCWAWGHSDSLYVALGLWSVWFIERWAGSTAQWYLLPAAALSCLSGFTKQTGAAFIVAGATALFVRRGRSGMLYAALSACIIGAVWTVWHIASGGQFERYMIMVLTDPYSLSGLVVVGKLILQFSSVLLIAGGWQLARDLRRGGWGDPGGLGAGLGRTDVPERLPQVRRLA